MPTLPITYDDPEVTYDDPGITYDGFFVTSSDVEYFFTEQPGVLAYRAEPIGHAVYYTPMEEERVAYRHRPPAGIEIIEE